MSGYVFEDDCEIVRGGMYPGSAALISRTGDLIFKVDDGWSDHQIWVALAIANNFYVKGVGVGSELKAKQIRKALSI